MSLPKTAWLVDGNGVASCPGRTARCTEADAYRRLATALPSTTASPPAADVAAWRELARVPRAALTFHEYELRRALLAACDTLERERAERPTAPPPKPGDAS